MLISRFCNECGSKNNIDDAKEKYFCSICGAMNVLNQLSKQVEHNTDSKPNEIQNNADVNEPTIKTVSGFAPPPKMHNANNINSSNAGSQDGNSSVPTKVLEVVDKNLPNICFDYKTKNNNVKMQIKVLCLGKTFDFNNGDCLEIYIPEGKQVVHFKIGSQNYIRTITIQKGIVIHINCSWNGHAEIKTDIPACLHVGDYYVQQEIIAKKKKSGTPAGSIIGAVFGALGIVFLIFVFASGIGSCIDKSKSVASNTRDADAVSTSNNFESNTNIATHKAPAETTEAQLPFAVASGTTNLSVGEIAKDGNYYYGLACVHSLDRVQTAIDSYSVNISSSQEVIYPIIEVYNASSKENKFRKGSISVYADSVKGSDPETNYLVGVDEIDEFQSYEVDANKTALIIEAFVVDKGWNELTVYWGDISWKLSPDEVSSEPFTYNSLYNLSPNYSYTSAESKIYDDEYELIFDGMEIYQHDSSFSGTTEFAVFEFTINNTSDSTLDYSLVGYEMRAYWNNQLLDSATYTMDDNINGYINVYDIGEIHAGMTAKVYVAFEITVESGVFECIYDVGYVNNEKIGYVCVEK